MTEAQHAPQSVQDELAGKPKDAFVIKYPIMVDGKEVALLCGNDHLAYAFPVYYFLRTYMNVEWVGPEAIGEIVPSNASWTMPASIDVLREPDYDHR